MTKTLFITGGAKRLGKATAEYFHQQGFNIVFTYLHSKPEALAFEQQLNQQRAQSAKAIQADISAIHQLPALAEKACQAFGAVDVLIHNASRFYSTEFSQATPDQWQDLLNSNCQSAYFLSQALQSMLAKRSGCIINLVDIYADKPLKNHSIYNISKAAIAMLTKSLAVDLAPTVRVNGIAPGAILWPAQGDITSQQALLDKIPLKRLGKPENIAQCAYFLSQNDYINGQIIAVDGGRSLTI